PRSEIQLGPEQLRGDDDADQHADDAPHHRHDGELPHDLVVVDGEWWRGVGRGQRDGGGGCVHAGTYEAAEPENLGLGRVPAWHSSAAAPAASSTSTAIMSG